MAAASSSEISQPTVVNITPKQNGNLLVRLRTKCSLKNELHRNVLIEFFCTGFLVFGGLATNCQQVLTFSQKNDYLAVTVGWALALLFAVYASYKTSGGHLNPAVSLFQLTMGKINAITFILYSIAQTAGAFFGAFFVYVLYYDAINHYDGGGRFVTGPRATAGIFATYPAQNLSMLGGIFDQIAGTAVLCFLIACVTDKRNKIPSHLQPAVISLILLFIGLTMGINSGYGINPARDFGPRLFTWIVGYGWTVFSFRNYCWFWIPLLCPLIGGVIGGWAYQLFIGIHLPDMTYEENLEYQTYLHQIPAVTTTNNSVYEVRSVHPGQVKPTLQYQQSNSQDQAYYGQEHR
uniref:Aquaporin n=1 Tax=Rhabditophanes sp. KR3021 TaxID=114890 RepID=A0AC35TNW5_9BILA